MTIVRFHTTIGPDQVIRAPEGVTIEPGDVEVTIVPLARNDEVAKEKEDEASAIAELRRITPSNEQLLKLAKSHPPPQSWLSEDEERPW